MVALALGSVMKAVPPSARCSMLHRLSRVAGGMWHMTNSESVRRVREHLQLLFDEQATNRLEPLVRDQLALASLNALLISLLPSLEGRHLSRLLPVRGLRYLDELQLRDKPILLLGAHYGIYGYAVAALLSARGYQASLVGYGGIHTSPPQTSRIYNRLYWPRVQGLRKRIHMATVNPSGELCAAMSPMLEPRAGVFYLLADQYFITRPDEHRLTHLAPVELLKKTVYLDTRVVQLAKEKGAKPLTAIPVLEEGLQVVLIEPMQWAGAGTKREDIAEDLQRYIARLEQRLLENPALWRDLRRPDLLIRFGNSGAEQLVADVPDLPSDTSSALFDPPCRERGV